MLSRTRDLVFAVLVLAALVAVCSAEVALKLGVAGAVLYVPVIWLAFFSGRGWLIWIAALLASALTGLSLYLTGTHGDPWQPLLDRSLALFAIWLTAILTQRLVRAPDEIRSVQSPRVLSTLNGALGMGRDASPNRLGRPLWTIIVASLGIHTACLVAARTWFRDWTYEQYPMHAAIEMAGALIALVVAWILLSLERRGAGTSYNVWIAGALLGMGVLDGLHATTRTGQSFVWLHSAATLFGGVLFSAVWLPSACQHRVAKWWPWAAIGVAAVVGGILMFDFQRLPDALVAGEFTRWSKAVNIVGGFLLFGASIRLFYTYFQNKNVDDLLFCLHCSLFGAAAVMFEQSRLWDLPWWGFHILRLMAYGVGLWFVYLTLCREQYSLVCLIDNLAGITENLENRVTTVTAELRERNVELERSNRDLQQFAYLVSHDLQEPLRAVASYCGLLEHNLRESLDEQSAEFMRHVTEGAQRMRSMIDSLLDYSRVETHGQQFDPCDARLAVNDALGMLSLLIEQSDAEIEIGPLPTVVADRSQLARIFQNLIGNAIKFCESGPPRVEVGAEESRRFWQFFVRDNGIGLDTRFAERAFLMFQRLNPQSKYPGTGLGLAISKRIVERHGGRIWVESTPGQGSTFYFTLAKRPSLHAKTAAQVVDPAR